MCKTAGHDTESTGGIVLRIHFTYEDLERTVVAPTADPLWEMLLSGFRLRENDRLPIFEPWARNVRADHRAREGMALGARLLAALAPSAPYFPDFLTPPEAGQGLASGLAALSATSPVEMRAQLTRLDAIAPLPRWIRPLADGDRDLLGDVATAFGRYHDAALGPYSDLVQRAVDADRSLRAQQFLTGGIEAMLTGIRPVAQWRRPVLEVEHAVEQDLHLRGRGLRLVPSFFCGRTACTLADPALPPTLVYPIDPGCRWTFAEADRRPLRVLIGATRAAVLAAVGTGATTTELARHVGTSPASASRHATVLRDCGLITTRRDGMAVVHNLTSLGEALLEHH